MKAFIYAMDISEDKEIIILADSREEADGILKENGLVAQDMSIIEDFDYIEEKELKKGLLSPIESIRRYR